MSTSQITATTVVLPSLGDNVTEATITRWLKAPGDTVEAEEALLEVATDKVDTEIPAPVAGTLIEILVDADQLVAIGTSLGLIAAAAATQSEASPQPIAEPIQPPQKPIPPQQSLSPTPSSSDAGPELPTAPREPVAPVTEESGRTGTRVERLPRIRQTIARRMMESLHTSAQLTTVVEADVTAIARLRSAHKDEFRQRNGVTLSFLPFFVKAAVEALAEHPVINACVNTDCTEVTYYSDVHLGMAVDSPKGLMVPVIASAQKLSIAAVAQAIAQRADEVRTGRIAPDALTGGTFTITNTGSRGALFDTPIINQPQSAILGVGAVADRVVPAYGDGGEWQVGVRTMAYLSLSYDHRLIDGADAARYLTTVRQRLETGFTPSELR